MAKTYKKTLYLPTIASKVDHQLTAARFRSLDWGIFIHQKFSNFIWLISYFVVFVLTRTFGQVKVEYQTNDFSTCQAPMIVISNHKGFLDPWIIFSSIPFLTYYQLLPIRPFGTKKFSKRQKLFQFLNLSGLIDLVYFLYNVIIINYQQSFYEKLAPLITALQNQQSLLIFPEGRLNYNTADIGTFKKGVVELHRKTGTPILPCAIKYHRRGLVGYKIEVSIGRPIEIPETIINQSNLDNIHLEGAEYLRRQVQELYEVS